MNSILLGHDAAGATGEAYAGDAPQHSYACDWRLGHGQRQVLEWIIRRDIREGNGLRLIDWHGSRQVLPGSTHKKKRPGG